ncbi:hypothetical protein AB0P36_04315 [Streptomyces flavidovirens]|uniref:hypothetical protein n=1 Tax=Streptomyces flavidovirens TaxID=67298 RepID=UPI00343D5153
MPTDRGNRPARCSSRSPGQALHRLPGGRLGAAAPGREAFGEHRDFDGRDLALVPTVFDRLDGLCRALVHRGWWLAGAGLAAFHPQHLPDTASLVPPLL